MTYCQQHRHRQYVFHQCKAWTAGTAAAAKTCRLGSLGQVAGSPGPWYTQILTMQVNWHRECSRRHHGWGQTEGGYYKVDIISSSSADITIPPASTFTIDTWLYASQIAGSDLKSNKGNKNSRESKFKCNIRTVNSDLLT